MPQYKYAPLHTDELPHSHNHKQSHSHSHSLNADGSSHSGNPHEDSAARRVPFCIGMCVLLAIVYVLSRTGEPVDCEPQIQSQTQTQSQSLPLSHSHLDSSEFDIGAYRAARLSQTPPHIIECAEAGEGGSQEKCHLSRVSFRLFVCLFLLFV